MQPQIHASNVIPFSGAIATTAVQPEMDFSITMTSLELVDLINEFRRAQATKAGQEFPSKGFAELRHDSFMDKVPEVLSEGGVQKFLETYLHSQNGQEYPCYRFPKREACLMAMSYSYELQAAVYDRMTALEERNRIPNFANPAIAARAWAEQYERRQIAEGQRDEAIRTKSQIGERREATAMNTASQFSKENARLKDTLGIGKNYRQVKAIDWLLDEFEESRAMFSQVGKKLKALSDRMGYEIHIVPDERYPGGVKAYHNDAIAAFRIELKKDRMFLNQYRKQEPKP